MERGTSEGLIASARHATGRDSPTAYALGRLLFRRGCIDYFCLCHAYFRWLDDQIDAFDVEPAVARGVIAAQSKLLESAYSGGRSILESQLHQHERMLVCLIHKDLDSGCHLRPYVHDMFEALRFDAERRYTICPQIDLDEYSTRLGRSYTSILLAFSADHPGVLRQDSNIDRAGFAAHQAHILRDFYSDLDLGYYNISAEDMSSFGGDIGDLRSADLRPWVNKIVARSYAAFSEGLQAIGNLPSVRSRLLGYATSARYLVILDKISCDEYHLRSSYISSAKEEARILGWALRMALVRTSRAHEFEAAPRTVLSGTDPTRQRTHVRSDPGT